MRRCECIEAHPAGTHRLLQPGRRGCPVLNFEVLQAMHISRYGKPSDAAAQFVQLYLQRETQLGATTLVHPVPARAAHVLTFQFGGPVDVRSYGADVTRTAETAPHRTTDAPTMPVACSGHCRDLRDCLSAIGNSSTVRITGRRDYRSGPRGARRAGRDSLRAHRSSWAMRAHFRNACKSPINSS